MLLDATVRCWGSNVAGDNLWTVPSFTPIAVTGLGNVSKLGVAGYSSCAVLRNGTTSCWGVSALPFSGFDGGVVDVAAGWGHQCALRSDGTVWCWGGNFAGELGDGTYSDHWTTPVQVVGVTNARAIGIGSRASCAILANNSTVMCWGDNTAGQMGTGSVGGAQPTATLVPGLDHVSELHGGWKHMCARKWDDSVWCWGLNDTGQVGDGTTTNRAQPVHVFP